MVIFSKKGVQKKLYESILWKKIVKEYDQRDEFTQILQQKCHYHNLPLQRTVYIKKLQHKYQLPKFGH